jgi:hypothetical protein
MTPTNLIGTFVAAKIARADGAPARALFDGLSIGQNLKLQVLRQLDQQRYEVLFGGRRHVVESRVPLSEGTQVEARVEGKGERLELRYLSVAAAQSETAEAEAAEAEAQAADAGADARAVEANTPPLLRTLAARYRVALDAEATATIARSAAQAEDPELMTRGGLFLQKLVQHVSAKDLDALYRALSVAERAPAAASTQPPIELGDLSEAGDFATTLADAFDAGTAARDQAAVPGMGAEAHDDGTGDDARRAVRLLNLQDEGRVAWRYGTLPLLVGGQLVELELVMFRERESHATRGSLRRLVMTLDTTHFGRVRVEARAVDDRLIVKLSAPHAEAVETLAGYGAEVRAAIGQLGWNVDDVRYEIEAPHASAAQAVVSHVLSAGSVDREI